ncbi:cation:proton antiporter [Parathalassolituus penaei]|uniref:Sodium:proton antiporter n=1 Tax=Parathalassolituus penaei TaxID=2997323 RepID=A0A9X3IT24_9GAMM|nr:sodium:proton antiporter [Parathalassolituus penaei]MCY0966441.1 sodium:proton antiporter [Parathalassolituus penaei]
MTSTHTPTELIPLMLAGIALTGFLCQWLAWRVRLPAILFLLISGLMLGPVSGLLDPDALLGNLLFPLISLAVAIILFEGSLTLNLQEIRNQRNVVRSLISVGAMASWVVTALVTQWLFEPGWPIAILFGALTVVTGPTVIVPMLRTVRPNAAISNILRWEGILIDPIGALLVVMVYEYLLASSTANGIGQGLLAFVEIIGIGSACGLAGGWLLGTWLRKQWIPEYLANLAALAVVLVTFSLSNYLAHESGLLAITLMGMWLANQRDLHLAEILNFKEHLTVVLISGLFVLLAARLTLPELLSLGWKAIVLLIAMQLLARPLSILLASWRSKLRWQEKALLAWIAPRGIVAAAVSALFAIKLEEAGVENASLLVPLTFSVIFGTVILQSATARPLARWLGVVEPPPHGILILGANIVARAIARELRKHNVQVLLADSSHDNIRAARMDGLTTFFGNPASDYAEARLDLTGLGSLLALSPDARSNAVASMWFQEEFGAQKVYRLQTSTESQQSSKHRHSEEFSGQLLFADHLTWGKFASLLSQGGQVRSTRLSEEFTFEDYQKRNGSDAMCLMCIEQDGKVTPLVSGSGTTPKAGQIVISLCNKAMLDRLAGERERTASSNQSI